MSSYQTIDIGKAYSSGLSLLGLSRGFRGPSDFPLSLPSGGGSESPKIINFPAEAVQKINEEK